MEASTALTPKAKAQSLMAVIEARKDQFKDLLPKYLTPEKLFRVAQMAISKQPLILNCTPASFLVAMMDAAKSGLEPDGRQAALVPYGNQVQFQPMYQGMIKQAVREGAAKKIEARVVHAHDRFRIWYDPEPHVEHEPCLEDEGDIIGAYAYAILPDGNLQVEWMNRRQLDHIKAKAKSRSGPWQTDEEEMFRKSPVKRLFKYLPIPETLEYAVSVDNAAETSRNRVEVPLLESIPVEKESKTEELAHKLSGGRGRPRKEKADTIPSFPADSPATTPTPSQNAPVGVTQERLAEILQAGRQVGMTIRAICDKYKVSNLEELDSNTADMCLGWLLEKTRPHLASETTTSGK